MTQFLAALWNAVEFRHPEERFSENEDPCNLYSVPSQNFAF